jgi:hypothetical protein
MASIFGMGTSMMGKGMDPQDLTWFKQMRKRMNQGMTPEIMKMTREPNRMGVSRETTKAPKGPSVFMRMSNGV